MTPSVLQSVLLSLTDAAAPAGDGELLRDFVATRSEAAFAELVRRHGRLVWAVCRHLVGSEAEAEDAFQATFLVLLRSADKVRDGAKLSSWLHGVAYRVCAKARLGMKRRTAREQAAAVGERDGPAVPASAWDRAMAAVHEEVAKLPETLRVPFVMCCLEGRPVTEAAQQVGWKLGTFSGRLTRAKDALLARLDARGLTLGVLACVGLAVPPAAAVAKAVALIQVGAVIPCAVLELTRGVIGMSANGVKMLAAAVVLTFGLGVAGWLGTAGAQGPGKSAPPKTATEAFFADYAVADVFFSAIARDAAAGRTERWEYDFVAVSDMTQAKFLAFLKDREARGWEYNGTTPMTIDGRQTTVWVFRRPPRALSSLHRRQSGEDMAFTPDGRRLAIAGHDGTVKLWDAVTGREVADDPKAIEAQIKQLQNRLEQLKTLEKGRNVISSEGLPVEPAEFARLLGKMAEKKFPGGGYKITAHPNSVVVEGNASVRKWALEVVEKFRDK